MSRPYATIDFAGQLIFLGTGTSVGVPALGCACDVCTSDNSKNRRSRSSVVLGLPEGNLLIDTTPDLRSQLLREGIGIIHSVLYTHDHADHVFGLDDVRLFPLYLGTPLPLFCEPQVEARIRRSFDYAFDGLKTHVGGKPDLAFRPISLKPFEVLGTRCIPIRLRHGRFDVLGFRFGNVAYCTDTNQIPDESWPLLEGLDVLVLDALRARPHATHFGIDEALEVVERVKPKRTLLIHMSHELDHEATGAALPDGVDLAYDGQRLELT